MARFPPIPTKGKRHSPIYEFKWGKRLLTLFNGITVSTPVYGSILNLLMAVVRVSMSFRPPWLQSLGKFCGLQAWDWAELDISFIYSFYGARLLGVYKFQWKETYKKFVFVKIRMLQEPRFQRIENFLSIFLILDSEDDYPSNMNEIISITNFVIFVWFKYQSIKSSKRVTKGIRKILRTVTTCQNAVKDNRRLHNFGMNSAR